MYQTDRLQSYCMDFIEDNLVELYKRSDFMDYLHSGDKITVDHIYLIIEEFEEENECSLSIKDTRLSRNAN